MTKPKKTVHRVIVEVTLNKPHKENYALALVDNAVDQLDSALNVDDDVESYKVISYTRVINGMKKKAST